MAEFVIDVAALDDLTLTRLRLFLEHTRGPADAATADRVTH